MEEENPKNYDWVYILVLFFVLAGIIFFVWYFGWRANQGEILQKKEPIIIKTIQ